MVAVRPHRDAVALERLGGRRGRFGGVECVCRLAATLIAGSGHGRCRAAAAGDVNVLGCAQRRTALTTLSLRQRGCWYAWGRCSGSCPTRMAAVSLSKFATRGWPLNCECVATPDFHFGLVLRCRRHADVRAGGQPHVRHLGLIPSGTRRSGRERPSSPAPAAPADPRMPRLLARVARPLTHPPGHPSPPGVVEPSPPSRSPAGCAGRLPAG